MIRIACSHPDCGKTFRVAESVAGRKVTCKSCGRDFVAQPVAQETPVAKALDTAADQSTPAAWVRDAALLSRIGRFEVRKKLGQGGFGTVYRAFDPQLERDVAVKVPKTELLASPKSVERFLREAKAAARLNHPHIVPVYDAGRDGELNYIASAFIDGQPLAAMIEPLAGDFRRIATLIRQLAEALDYAHSQGVIHRDVKPDNVMIDSAGQPHLMDFGLARIGDAAQKLTHDGTVMGTPAYMSPEQACDDPSAVTHASDQYSLGVVLYELLTGDTPFSGPPAIIIFNTLNQPIPAPRSLRADLPPDLETICLKALSRESSARYATCADFAADLERWLKDEPIQARRISRVERLLRWCRREPVVAGMTAAIVLVTILGFSAVTWQWQQAVKAQSERVLAQVDALLKADIGQVPYIIESLKPYREQVVPRLQQLLHKEEVSPGERLRLSLALVATDDQLVAELYDRLLGSEPREFVVLRDALGPYAEQLKGKLWEVLGSPAAEPGRKLRAACTLATYDAVHPRWTDYASFLAESLVGENPLVVVIWLEALRPVKQVLLEPLSALYRDKTRPESARSLATMILTDYVADNPDILVELLKDGDQKQFDAVLTKLQQYRDRAAELLNQAIAKPLPLQGTEAEKDAVARQQGNAAVALLRLAEPANVWSVLKRNPDPRVRTYVIHRVQPFGVASSLLVDQLEVEADVGIRQALILALGEFEHSSVSAAQQQPVIAKLTDLYEKDPDPGIHGATEWTLRRWKKQSVIAAIDGRLATGRVEGNRRWYVNGQGQTMVVIGMPVEFRMGSPETEVDRASDETQHNARIDRSFAIAAKEVTTAQFARFQQENRQIRQFDIKRHAPDADCPILSVDWYDAAAYCNWVSEKEGFPAKQWCYAPNSAGKYAEGMQSAPDYLTRTGYRLPTEAEWECACRAETLTGRFCGASDEFLPKYAWSQGSAKDRSWPVGLLKPNEWGLFDVLGNSLEWCDDLYAAYPTPKSGLSVTTDTATTVVAIRDRDVRVLRGGSWLFSSQNSRSADRNRYTPDYRGSGIGVRLAKTL